MNKTGKSKLVMTIALSIMLIVQMVVFAVMKKDSNGIMYMMFGLIVLMAVVAVAFSYFNLRQLRERVSSLPDSYKDVYIDAQEMINLSNLSKGMKQEIKTAVLEIFEHAALDNRSVEDVMGGDLKSFIGGFIAASGGKFNLTYLLSYSTSLFIGYLLLMKVYKMSKVGMTLDAIETQMLDMGIIASYALISFVFLPWLLVLMRKAAVERWSMVKRGWIIAPLLIPIAILFILIGVENESFRAFLDYEVGVFNSPIKIMLGLVLLFVSVYFIKWSRKKQLNC